MKLTNKLGLPQPLVDAVTNDPYTKGDADYSVTGLLKPPQIAALERKHWDEIEEDASDRLWSLFGQVVHGILERAEREAWPEERLYMDFDGVRVSGQMDRYLLAQDLLQDYKFISLDKLREGLPPDFEQQVNLYVYLIRRNGYRVRRAEIVAMLRDWKRGRSKRDPSYPQQGVVIISVPIWPIDRTVQFLHERIKAHEKAKMEIPQCSPEDRWATAEGWAVTKHGGKRATKVYPTEKEAINHVEVFGDKYFITQRFSESKRCEGWCRAAPFCEQWKAIKGEMK